VSTSASSAVPALLNILIEPRKTLSGLLENKKLFWLPILVSLAAGELFWVWYFFSVDFAWLKDFMLDTTNPNATAQQRAAMAPFVSWNTQFWVTVIGVFVVMAVTYTVQAAYLLMVSRVQDDDNSSFLDWFNLTAWAYFPRILATVLAALTFATAANGQIAPTELNPASLNAIFFHFPANHVWAGLANSVDLTLFWSVFLLGLGFSLRKQMPLSRGLLVAAVPYVLIYGIWAAVKLASGG